jgi:uncharacterized protein YbjT (DUF2867 family)
MKIVVVGGTGLIGSQLVKILRGRGHEVVPASPKLGVNAVTGEGLVQAMANAEAVFDVSNSPSFEDSAVLTFFKTTGNNLLAAESQAGVKHHVVLSVVGTDRLLSSGYFRGKMMQETLVKASNVPFTILRATQFFEFIISIAPLGADKERVRLSPAMMQPVASADVATALADIVLADPVNKTLELGGPEKFRIADIVATAMAAKGDSRQIIADRQAPYFGVVVDEESLIPGPNAQIGKIVFAKWLSGRSSNKQ